MNLKSYMQKTITVLLVSLILLVNGNYANAEIFNTAMQTDYNYEKIRELINSERAKLDLPPVQFSGKLQLGALHKAIDMHEHSYFAHYRPSDNSMGIKELAGMVDFKYSYIGETLALNYNTEQSVVTGFMNSPSHKDILMSPKAKYIGIDFSNYYYNGQPSNVVVVLVGDTYSNSNLTSDQENELNKLTKERNDITDSYYKVTGGTSEPEEVVFEKALLEKGTLKLVDDNSLSFEFSKASAEKELKVIVFGFKKPYADNPYKYKFHTIDNTGLFTESLEDLEMSDFDDFYVSLVTVDQDGKNNWSFFELVSR